MITSNIYVVQEADWPSIVQAIGAILAACLLGWNLWYQRIYTLAQVDATKTLIESTDNQILANKAQLDMAERDYQRFLRESIPLPEFTFQQLSRMSGNITYLIKNNAAFNLSITNPDEKYIELTGLADEAHDLNTEVTIDIHYRFVEEFFEEFVAKNGRVILLILKFADFNGVHYRQNFFLHLDKGIVFSMTPELISTLT